MNWNYCSSYEEKSLFFNRAKPCFLDVASVILLTCVCSCLSYSLWIHRFSSMWHTSVNEDWYLKTFFNPADLEISEKMPFLFGLSRVLEKSSCVSCQAQAGYLIFSFFFKCLNVRMVIYMHILLAKCSQLHLLDINMCARLINVKLGTHKDSFQGFCYFLLMSLPNCNFPIIII